MTDIISGLMLFAIIFGFYLFPSIIALSRGHHQAAAIVVLNLFLGWTFLGWVLALVWSATATRRVMT